MVVWLYGAWNPILSFKNCPRINAKSTGSNSVRMPNEWFPVLRTFTWKSLIFRPAPFSFLKVNEPFYGRAKVSFNVLGKKPTIFKKLKIMFGRRNFCNCSCYRLSQQDWDGKLLLKMSKLSESRLWIFFKNFVKLNWDLYCLTRMSTNFNDFFFAFHDIFRFSF